MPVWTDPIVNSSTRRAVSAGVGDPANWGERHFGKSGMTDKRRQQRLVTIATAMAAHPGQSIPQLFDRSYDVKAAYSFFKHREATPDRLQACHRDLTRRQMDGAGTVLLLEDTTELAWSSLLPIVGLGPIGQGGRADQGFLLHSVLAVRWSEDHVRAESPQRPPLEVLGIADQQYRIRQAIPRGERGDDSTGRKKRPRESQLWENASQRLGSAPDGSRWVRVADRGADIWEMLLSCRQLGHGYVIRASQDRALVSGGRLFESVRRSSALGGFDLLVRARGGRPARTARLLVGADTVTLRAPQRPGTSKGGLPPMTCTVVRVWEAAPPAGVEGLEWMLLVDEAVQTFDQALTCALQYATRWVIEDFHKCLKTGLGAERLQLEDAHRLFAAIAVMSVVALRLLDLRERLRIDPGAPASDSGLTHVELRLLAGRTNRRLTTVAHVALALGRLGGHMNRKGDGMPGLITLWRGINELQSLVAGATQGLQFSRFG